MNLHLGVRKIIVMAVDHAENRNTQEIKQISSKNIEK